VIDKTAYRVALRRDEWEIATTLQKISQLRAKVSQAEASGPESSSYRKYYTDYQNEAQNRITDRVEKLEQCVPQIKVADGAYRDHEDALKLAELRDDHLDLLLETEVKGQRTTSEISDLTQQALFTWLALIDSLIEANEAGMLALPNLADPGKPAMANLLLKRSRIHWMLRHDDLGHGYKAIADLARAIEIDPSRTDIRAEWEELRQQWRRRNK
jgi:hypothetical protein